MNGEIPRVTRVVYKQHVTEINTSVYDLLVRMRAISVNGVVYDLIDTGKDATGQEIHPDLDVDIEGEKITLRFTRCSERHVVEILEGL